MKKSKILRKTFALLLTFALVIGTIGASDINAGSENEEVLSENEFVEAELREISKSRELPDLRSAKGQRLIDVFNDSIAKLQIDAPMDFPEDDKINSDSVDIELDDTTLSTGNSSLGRSQENKESIYYPIDWSISRIKELRDFAGNLYTLVELNPFGYMIYHNDSGLFAERSGFEPSPYKEVDSDLYYGGYARHFYGKDEGSVICIYTEDIIDSHTIEKNNWVEQSEDFADVLLANSDYTRINYVEYGIVAEQQSGGGNRSGSSTPTYLNVVYRANGGTGTVPISHFNILSGSSITIRNHSLSRSGFTFRGWRSSTSSIVYQVAETAKITGSGTIYLDALWMPDPNGNYTQSISERENNESFNRANPIPGGLVDITGTISSGDVDFFRLYNNTTSAVEILLSAPLNSTCRIDVFSGASDLSWYGTTSNTNSRYATMTASFEAGQSYYIKITNTSGNSGTYAINIRRPDWAYMFRARTGFANKVTHGFPHYSDCYGTCYSSRCHTGMDIVNNEGGGARAYGMSVYAVAAGKVTTATYLTGYGQCVQIQHTSPYSSRTTVYAHLGTGTIPANVYQNATVYNGTKIGEVGWTGNVIPANINGSHLHFEVRVNGEFTNPFNYFPSGTFIMPN